MKTVAIISKPGKSELETLIPELLGWFDTRGHRVVMDQETAVYGSNDKVFPRKQIAEQKPDFALVLGGDGTLLSAARNVSQYGIPIVAVNLGTLGFLTDVSIGELYRTLSSVEHGTCAIEERSLLTCRLMRAGACVEKYDALNDAVVNKSAIARLVGFELRIDGNSVFSYKADGIIVATPTGSTAYSLAAGGPILTPSVDAFVITPVSPHSLTHRPLVVSDTAKIEIVVASGHEKTFLTIDGQLGMPVEDGDRIECVRASHTVKLFRSSSTFFDVLQNKLKWGTR